MITLSKLLNSLISDDDISIINKTSGKKSSDQCVHEDGGKDAIFEAITYPLVEV